MRDEQYPAVMGPIGWHRAAGRATPRLRGNERFLREIAELQKRPGEWHTYRLTQVSLWNAAAAGRDCEYVIRQLTELARNEIPHRLEEEIRSQMSRYGQLRLSLLDGRLTLTAESAELMELVCGWETVSSVFACPLWRPASSFMKVRAGGLNASWLPVDIPLRTKRGFMPENRWRLLSARFPFWVSPYN